MKRTSAVFLIFVLLVSLCCFGAAEENDTAVSANQYIEAVDICLPDVQIYVNGATYSQDMTAKASLDGEALTFRSAKPYNPDTDKTRIYILADISGSVSASMFRTVTSCVKTFMSGLTANQSVRFYTFSQDVQEVLTGSESYDEACAKLDALRVTGNGYTALYDALYLIHEQASQERDSFDRQVVFIFTDGVDEDNRAKRTFDETKNILKSHEIPVYSMCMDYADANAKDKLGEISRVSGGVNVIFNANNIGAMFQSLTDTAFSCVRLNFTKNNNKAGDKDKNLSVSVNGNAYPAVTVYESAVRIQEDNTAPEYTVEFSKADNCMVIAFSEAVLNADKADSYVITDKSGSAVSVESVQYDSTTHTAYLYFSQRVYSGSYTVALSGVTDDSYAANLPVSPVTADLTASSSFLKILDYWWIFLIPLFIAIIVLLVLLVVKRKRNITTVKELFEVENEHNYEVKHHIVNPSKGREIVLKIVTDHTSNEIKTRISTSLIFGRSDACDICIDDVKLSRQHFAFEAAENGVISLCDLRSTNGTFLNGAKITGKAPLKSGDVISAGLTKITVSF